MDFFSFICHLQTFIFDKRFRRHDQRADIASLRNESARLGQRMRIRHVPAVPCQENIHSRDGRGGDVKSIRRLALWQGVPVNERSREARHFLHVDLDQGDSLQEVYPSRNRVRASDAGFLDDILRDIDIAFRSCVVPPLPRIGLVGGDLHVIRGIACQVADERRLAIHFQLFFLFSHFRSLLPRVPPENAVIIPYPVVPTQPGGTAQVPVLNRAGVCPPIPSGAGSVPRQLILGFS